MQLLASLMIMCWNKDAAISEPAELCYCSQDKSVSSTLQLVTEESCCTTGSSWQYCFRFPEMSLPWVISQKTVQCGWVPRSVTSLGHKTRITWASCPLEHKWHKASFRKTEGSFSHWETSFSLFWCLFLALVKDVKRVVLTPLLHLPVSF